MHMRTGCLLWPNGRPSQLLLSDRVIGPSLNKKYLSQIPFTPFYCRICNFLTNCCDYVSKHGRVHSCVRAGPCRPIHRPVYAARIHCPYTAVYTAVYTARPYVRPWTQCVYWPCTRRCIHGLVRTPPLHGRVRGPYTCTRPCTRPCTGPCTLSNVVSNRLLVTGNRNNIIYSYITDGPYRCPFLRQCICLAEFSYRVMHYAASEAKKTVNCTSDLLHWHSLRY